MHHWIKNKFENFIQSSNIIGKLPKYKNSNTDGYKESGIDYITYIIPIPALNITLEKRRPFYLGFKEHFQPF